MAWSAAISWIVLRPLIASMATLALNSGLWVRRLLIGGSPFQGRCPASEVNDGGCPKKPDHLIEDSELGEIPSGWQVSSLGEVTELAYGKPLKEEQRKGGAYPVFGSNGVVGSHDEYLVEAPGIVVGRKGNPGTVEWSEKNFYPIDTTFFVVNKKAGLGMRFLFYCLRNQNLADLSADSAVPGLNRNHAYMNNQLLPPIEVASAFERHLEIIFKRKEFLADEINALGATRDALLPKLISGEIRIPDAEKMLEEVGV